MRLRQKLSSAIGAVMSIVFLLSALVAVLNAIAPIKQANIFQNSIDRAAERKLKRAIKQDTLKGWLEFTNECALLRPNFSWMLYHKNDLKTTIGLDVNQDECRLVAEVDDYSLYIKETLQTSTAFDVLGGLFWIMLIGTLIMMFVIYGLLLRLVIRPIEKLNNSSKLLSEGRGVKVYSAARGDEIGELITVFNKMSESVTATQKELEERVEKAVKERSLATQKLALDNRLAATGRLAAGLAHEINNPLGGMINAARSIAGGKLTDERRAKYVELIKDGLGRIAKLVERMRSFVRANPIIEKLQIASVIEKAVAFVEHRITKDNVKLLYELNENICIEGDAVALQQVFMNIILNALDAVQDSKEKVLKITSKTDETGDTAKCILTFRDTGSGVPPNQLESVFDIFYSTKGKGGTGLGLGIAHSIVADHGGVIALSNYDDGVHTGAEVTLELPLFRDEMASNDA